MKSMLAKPILLLLILGATLVAAEPFAGIPSDKTLVVWTSPANLTQGGGSTLTIDDRHSHFDGIVFGEIASARWMAGSDFYHRTLRQQDSLPTETSQPGSFVQIAIVYRGKDVTVFRNGMHYSSHTIQHPHSFGKESVILIGLRHLDSHDGTCFEGQIDDARIYGFALSAEQIRVLKPNQPSDPKPMAWWHFENGTAEDAMQTFPLGQLVGKATINSGKLTLEQGDSYLVTPPTDIPSLQASVPPDVTKEWVLNYHLMHPGAESLPGDPNAAFCLDGTYHLHYILAHPWRRRGTFCFVHVTSPDMLHWTWQTTQLQRSHTGHGMFSGTGFETKEGRPAAIYHGESSGRNQIAIAADRKLSSWEKPYPVDVRLADGSEAKMNHWDPDCFRVGDTYYAISGGPNPPVFKSSDLKSWRWIGDFVRHHPQDVTIGEDISCPNFFPLGNKWMLLCISHSLGCRYYLGDWDQQAEQFVPQSHGRMNWARRDEPVWGLFRRTDFFAPESVQTPDGRRVMWAWLTSVGRDNQLLNKTIQSLPRELSLAADGTLQIRPLRELEAERYAPVTLNQVSLANPIMGHGDAVPPESGPHLQRIADLPGDSLEIRITVARDQVNRKLFGFTLFADEKGNGLPILLRPETGTLCVGTTEAPFAVADLPEGEDLELRIFIDKYLVEVFANNRQAIVSSFLPPPNQHHLDGFTIGAPTELKQIEIWQLHPTNQGFWEAQKNRIWEPKTK